MSQKFRFTAVIEDAGGGGAYVRYTHQKETIRWIEEAKRESARQGRIERAIERLKQGKRGI